MGNYCCGVRDSQTDSYTLYGKATSDRDIPAIIKMTSCPHPIAPPNERLHPWATNPSTIGGASILYLITCIDVEPDERGRDWSDAVNAIVLHKGLETLIDIISGKILPSEHELAAALIQILTETKPFIRKRIIKLNTCQYMRPYLQSSDMDLRSTVVVYFHNTLILGTAPMERLKYFRDGTISALINSIPLNLILKQTKEISSTPTHNNSVLNNLHNNETQNFESRISSYSETIKKTAVSHSNQISPIIQQQNQNNIQNYKSSASIAAVDKRCSSRRSQNSNRSNAFAACENNQNTRKNNYSSYCFSPEACDVYTATALDVCHDVLVILEEMYSVGAEGEENFACYKGDVVYPLIAQELSSPNLNLISVLEPLINQNVDEVVQCLSFSLAQTLRKFGDTSVAQLSEYKSGGMDGAMLSEDHVLSNQSQLQLQQNQQLQHYFTDNHVIQLANTQITTNIEKVNNLSSRTNHFPISINKKMNDENEMVKESVSSELTNLDFDQSLDYHSIDNDNIVFADANPELSQ